MNLIGQVVNLEKMCIISRNYDGFTLFPLGLYTPLPINKAHLNDEPTTKFDRSKLDDFLRVYKLEAKEINRGLLVYKTDSSEPLFFIPTNDKYRGIIDQFCFPIQENSKYDMIEFERQKLFALKYKKYISYLIQCNINFAIQVDEVKFNNYTQLHHIEEEAPHNVVYCTAEIKPFIELMKQKKIRSNLPILPSLNDIHQLQLYSNETAYKDRNAKRVCFPYITFISQLIDPVLYSVNKQLYLVQVTSSLNKAYTVCSHWKSNKVNLGFSPKSSLDVRETCRVYITTSEGIASKDKEFIIQYKYAEGEYSYYCFLLVN